jgi:hypothetical protein
MGHNGLQFLSGHIDGEWRHILEASPMRCKRNHLKFRAITDRVTWHRFCPRLSLVAGGEFRGGERRTVYELNELTINATP